MTKRDLMDAYVSGRLDRRYFVRGLTALGVSAGAATAYAHSLRPVAASSGGVSPSGFVKRMQQDADADYATACDLESDAEGIAAVLASLATVLGILEAGLAIFGEDDFPSLGDVGLSVYEELETMRDEVADQVDALQALSGDVGASAAAQEVVEEPEGVDAFLELLANALNESASLLAGVTPAIEDGEARQTLMNIGVVVGRHAGFANILAGTSPSGSGFEEPTCP